MNTANERLLFPAYVRCVRSFVLMSRPLRTPEGKSDQLQTAGFTSMTFFQVAGITRFFAVLFILQYLKSTHTACSEDLLHAMQHPRQAKQAFPHQLGSIEWPLTLYKPASFECPRFILLGVCPILKNKVTEF